MNDAELDAAVAAATIGEARVAALDLGGADVQLREAIVAAHPVPDGGRRWALRAVSGALAAAAVIVLAVVVVGSLLPSRQQTAWAASVLAVAQSAPRYLLDGWTVTRANQFTAEYGGMWFADGARELELTWRPLDTHADFVADRNFGTDELEGVQVAGRPAQVFRYGFYDGGVDLAALWRSGEHSLEARAHLADEDEFRRALAALTEVDVDGWLSAMPANVVRPDVREDAIAGMLEGIPLPPGFDPATLDGDGVSDRYQLGAQVTGAVSCGWLDTWVAATDRGDTAAAQAAVDAMATSRDWAILREMDAEGDYPEVLWEYADDIAADGDQFARSRDGYRSGLGCDPPGY